MINKKLMFSIRPDYTPRESKFLSLAAVHSGCFLARQYITFLGVKGKGRLTDFIRKALRFGHIKRQRYGRNNAQLYTLTSTLIRERNPDPYWRSRQLSSDHRIFLRLRALDFVLRRLDGEYFETEQQKIHYFVHEKKLSPILLPSQLFFSRKNVDRRRDVRHDFPDQFPMFLDQPEQPESAPRLNFTYLDDGGLTLHAFATYLRAYAPLFRALNEPFKLIFVDSHFRRFRQAEHYFYWFLSSTYPVSYLGPLLRYFELRKTSEAEMKSGKPFSFADYDELWKEKRRYSEEFYDDLYREWLVEGNAPVERFFASNPDQKTRGVFDAQIAPKWKRGSFLGESWRPAYLSPFFSP